MRVVCFISAGVVLKRKELYWFVWFSYVMIICNILDSGKIFSCRINRVTNFYTSYGESGRVVEDKIRFGI